MSFAIISLRCAIIERAKNYCWKTWWNGNEKCGEVNEVINRKSNESMMKLYLFPLVSVFLNFFARLYYVVIETWLISIERNLQRAIIVVDIPEYLSSLYSNLEGKWIYDLAQILSFIFIIAERFRTRWKKKSRVCSGQVYLNLWPKKHFETLVHTCVFFSNSASGKEVVLVCLFSIVV